MRHYPLFLDLRTVRCLVVGAGAVGRRKIASLLACEPLEVLVIDPALDLELAEGAATRGAGAASTATPAAPDEGEAAFWQHPRLRCLQRTVEEDDLDGRGLVFAATGDRTTNAALAAACARRGIWCNVADAPDESTFLVPASLKQGRVELALSTGGASPALTRWLREELEQWLETRFAPLAEVLARLRPLVLALGRETGHNTALFRALVRSELPQALATRDSTRCRELLRLHLPEELHCRITELLHGLV